MSADLIARLQVCAKFDPDQAEAIKVIQSQAAEITHLRAVINEIMTPGDNYKRLNAALATARREGMEEAAKRLIEKYQSMVIRPNTPEAWRLSILQDLREMAGEKPHVITAADIDGAATARREGMEMPSEFLQWMKDQMPSGTHIHNPEWWAKRIWEAAIRAAAGEVKS